MTVLSILLLLALYVLLMSWFFSQYFMISFVCSCNLLQPSEKQRIVQAGGFVAHWGVWRVNGILATSRALGDLMLKEKKVLTAEPEFVQVDLKQVKARFVILASDGLWDVFTNEQAVQFVREHFHEKDYGAASLVKKAIDLESLDNITVIIIKLSD